MLLYVASSVLYPVPLAPTTGLLAQGVSSKEGGEQYPIILPEKVVRTGLRM